MAQQQSQFETLVQLSRPIVPFSADYILAVRELGVRPIHHLGTLASYVLCVFLCASACEDVRPLGLRSHRRRYHHNKSLFTMHAAAKWITLNSAAGGVLRGNLSLLARAAQIQGFMAEAAPESCRSLHTLRALIRSCWALSCHVLWHTIASKFRIKVC
jgi:hypothetical protein